MTQISGLSSVQVTVRTYPVAIEAWGEPADKASWRSDRGKPRLESGTMTVNFACTSVEFYADNPWLALVKDGKVTEMLNVKDVIRIHYFYSPQDAV